jgi:uncharacterized membrane protein YkoI
MKKRISAAALSLILFLAIFSFIPFNTVYAASKITLADAREIALKDAGLEENDVTIAKAKTEYVLGVKQYEIVFYYGTTEYSYEISVTGDIVSSEVELESIHAEENPRESLDDTNPSSNTSSITEDDALEIALADASYTKDDLRYSKVTKDYIDGRGIYEVLFIVGRYQYSYDIEIETGNIFNYEVSHNNLVISLVNSLFLIFS